MLIGVIAAAAAASTNLVMPHEHSTTMEAHLEKTVGDEIIYTYL